MTVSQLHTNEYHPYYENYLKKANQLPLIQGLDINGKDTLKFLKSISENLYDYAYAEGKWTIKEVVQHIIDTERIFTYRALAIARGEHKHLPGYEQDDYAHSSNANLRTKQSLLDEFKVVREASILLYKSFTENMLTLIGTASDSSISVRAIAFILTGHENHHCQIIKERYL